MSINQIEALAWDFDGTIVDNQHIFFSAVQKTFEHTDHVFTFENEGEGRSLDDFYKSLPSKLKSDMPQSIWSEKVCRICFEELNESHIRPGVKAVLEDCKDKGIPQVCVSNSGRKSLLDRMEKLEIRHFFQEIISANDVAAPKPDPHPYNLAIEKLRLSPQSVLAIEDSFTGFRSAAAAGMKTAAFPINENTNHIFKDACYVLQDITVLKSIL